MRLRVNGLVKSFAGQTALREVTFMLPEFHALAVIGPSGGGKSTLLRILAGLEIPDRGEVAIDDTPLTFDERNLLAHRRTIGTVFQAFNLFPHLTALENITLPLVRVHGLAREEATAIAWQTLERLQLKDHAVKRPLQLSGGQQQRVAIARAIAVKPRFLLFDEPTSALDPEMTAEVLDVIGELRREGRDLVLVTHHMGFASTVADQCLFVCDGRVTEAGPAAQVFGAPQGELLRHFLAKVLKY